MTHDIVKQAKEWWGKHVNQRPVWRIDDLPELKFKEILLSLHLAYEVRRDTIVLGKPDTELSMLIHSYFWEILSCVLKPYLPYAITGIAAIRFHLGDESIPNKFDILTRNSSSRINLHDISLLSLEKNPQFFEQSSLDQCVTFIETNKNYSLTIESPESLLVRLRPQHFRDFPQMVSGFLKAVDFNLERLSELLLRKSKPVTHLRLAALFEQVGKKKEAQLFKNSIKAMTHYATPGKAQILGYSLPAAIAMPKRISDPGYVARFRDQLCIYKERVDMDLKNLHLPHWDFKKIKAYAEKTMKYDTYHSSTIEGYRVSPEEIQMLIDGREILSVGKSREEVERKMALKGYLEAHNYVVRMIEEDFKNERPLSEFVIREMYANLFSPSVEAGILEKKQLTQYRNDAVFTRNSRHVPVNYLKIDELMRCLIEEINNIKNSSVQAIIAHYGFVTIHPYFDGNGRVARLLMNYLLCRGGIPWITIRVEDRAQYFKALESAQCDEDIELFAKFLRKYFEESKAFNIDL
jgi:hypothetical protein